MVLIDDELGLAPGVHSLWQRLRRFLSKRGIGRDPQHERPLDPMVVDHEAWRVMRRSTRTWPDYREVPNSFRIGVSKADWDEYWGIDTTRKSDNVARYLVRQAADKDLWIAGTPQVEFFSSEEVPRGEVSVEASFAEARGKAHKVEPSDLPTPDYGIAPAASYAEDSEDVPSATVTSKHARPQTKVSPDSTVVVRRGGERPAEEDVLSTDAWEQTMPTVSPGETVVLPRPTMPVHGADDTQTLGSSVIPDETEVLPLDVPRSAYLVDDAGFRMLVHPGDVIGAVHDGESMSADVNIRLDGRGFPHVEPRHLSLAATASGWTVTNLAQSGTRIDDSEGKSRTLGLDEVALLHEGDTLYLGPERPLRFQFGM